MVKNTSSKVAKKAPAQAKKAIEKAAKPPTPIAQAIKKKDGPKWRLSDLKMGQIMSMTSYLTVIGLGNANHNLITVKNQFGQDLQMSKDLLETMYSADHFDRE